MLVATVALLGACGGSGDAKGAASPPPPKVTVPDDTTTTTAAAGAPTTGVAPEYAVPPAIDEAYVTRVLAVLDHVQGDVFRRIVATGAFAPSDLLPLRAVFNDPELTGQAQGFATLVQSIDKAKNPPGDNHSTVVRLLTARPDCIYAETTVDLSDTVLEPPPPRTSFVALRPSQPGSDPNDLNPTPFSIVAEHTKATDPCG
jgi:hypothetical protein